GQAQRDPGRGTVELAGARLQAAERAGHVARHGIAARCRRRHAVRGELPAVGVPAQALSRDRSRAGAAHAGAVRARAREPDRESRRGDRAHCKIPLRAALEGAGPGACPVGFSTKWAHGPRGRATEQVETPGSPGRSVPWRRLMKLPWFRTVAVAMLAGLLTSPARAEGKPGGGRVVLEVGRLWAPTEDSFDVTTGGLRFCSVTPLKPNFDCSVTFAILPGVVGTMDLDLALPIPLGESVRLIPRAGGSGFGVFGGDI